MAYDNVFATDRELLLRFQAGDDAAFDLILDRYEERVYTGLCSIVNRQVAQELAQESFLIVMRRALRGWFKRDVHDSILGLLTRIARNLAFSHLRRERAKRRYVELKSQYPQRQKRPDEIYEEKVTAQKVRLAMLTLLPVVRRTVMMTWVERLTLREVAHRTKASVSTVKRRLEHAREILKLQLAPYWKGAQ